MRQVLQLIKKDIRIDWRNPYPVAGIVLYLTSIILTTYFAYSGAIDVKLWNTLFWVSLLFTSVNAIAKGFLQDEDRSLYYFFTIKPSSFVLSKLIYNFAYQLALALATIVLFLIFFGDARVGLEFMLILLIGSLGLSSAFTFISSIAAKTNNPSIMMSILGFPIIIPVLILSIQSSKTILLGGEWADIQTNFLTLLSLNVIIIALTFILFPFTWKS